MTARRGRSPVDDETPSHRPTIGPDTGSPRSAASRIRAGRPSIGADAVRIGDEGCVFNTSVTDVGGDPGDEAPPGGGGDVGIAARSASAGCSADALAVASSAGASRRVVRTNRSAPRCVTWSNVSGGTAPASMATAGVRCRTLPSLTACSALPINEMMTPAVIDAQGYSDDAPRWRSTIAAVAFITTPASTMTGQIHDNDGAMLAPSATARSDTKDSTNDPTASATTMTATRTVTTRPSASSCAGRVALDGTSAAGPAAGATSASAISDLTPKSARHARTGARLPNPGTVSQNQSRNGSSGHGRLESPD